MSTNTENWFAIQVKPTKETMVANHLAQKSYKHFLPLWKPQGDQQGRRKTEFPLFPGYLFCRFSLESRVGLVITTPGVLRIVGRGNKPEPIPEGDIENLVRVTQQQGEWCAEDRLHVGAKVRIVRGSFAGTEGILSEIRGKYRVVVQIALLGGGVSVETEECSVVHVSDDLPEMNFTRGQVLEYCVPAGCN